MKFIADFLGSLFSFQKMLTCDKKERPKAPHVWSPLTSKHHWVTEETIRSRSIKLNLELCWTNWICQWSTVLLSRYLMIAWTQAGESQISAARSCDLRPTSPSTITRVSALTSLRPRRHLTPIPVGRSSLRCQLRQKQLFTLFVVPKLFCFVNHLFNKRTSALYSTQCTVH